MPRKQEFVVIGLGRFGTSLALKLAQTGHAVLAIDREPRVVQGLADELAQVVALDATDEDALRSVGVEEFDTAIVAIGNDFESNILITVLLKQLGLTTVICKALNDRQKTILLKVGADQVILPEHEAGVRLAHQLVSQQVIDRLELEPGISISVMDCPKALAGRSLGELGLPDRFGVNVLLIKGPQGQVQPRVDTMLNPADRLYLLGPDEGIVEMQQWEP